MNLLVTGASGFVGKHLIESLAFCGHSGIAVSRSFIERVPQKWRWLSRADALSLPEGPVPDAVIHLEVKQHAQNPTRADLVEFQTVNVEGTKEWLKWAAIRGIKLFIYFSSIKAAGSSPSCQNELLISQPNSPYGESKLGAEKLLAAWALEDKARTAIIVRPGVVYGPGSQANIFSLVDAIYRGRFFLVGKNDNIKSMISLRNLLAAIDHLLALPLSGTHLFYLTDKESFSVAEISGMIAEILDKNQPFSLPLVVAKSVACFGDAVVKLTGRGFPLTSNRLNALLENTHFSSAKLQETGFVYPQTTREGLKEMITWYLRSHGLPGA